MTHPLVDAFGEEFATVLSALLGTPTSSSTTAPPPAGDGWLATLTAEPPATGAWTVFIGSAGATAIVADILGLTAEEAVPAPAVGDTLREALTQAASALGMEDAARGLTVRVGTLAAAPAPPTQNVLATFTITCGAVATPVSLTVCGGIELPAGPSASPNAFAGTFAAQPGATGAVAAPGSDRLDAILDIELPLIVRFGRTELPLKTLAQLGPGSLIDLGRSADDPVDLLVSNRVVARGEVVVVGGNYGVRVLDVVSPRERARSMEG